MDAAVSGLVGVVIGAVSSSFLTEYYKRYRDRRALAFALRGEIRAHLSALPAHSTIFKKFAEQARLDQPVALFPFDPPSDPIFEKGVDKIGLLEGDLPERLAYFYARLNGYRRVLQMTSRKHFGETGTPLATVFTNMIAQIEEVAPVGQRLVDELGVTAEPRFYAHARKARGLWQRLNQKA